MKHALLLAGALALAATPSYALTAGQLAAKVAADLAAGYHCDPSKCTKNSNGTVTVRLPDGTLVTLVSPETPAHGGNHGDGICPPFQHQVNGFKNHDGTPFCVQIGGTEIAGLSGGRAIYKTTVVPGGTRSDPVCNKARDDFGFDPRGGLNGFSVTSSSSQTAGAC